MMATAWPAVKSVIGREIVLMETMKTTVQVYFILSYLGIIQSNIFAGQSYCYLGYKLIKLKSFTLCSIIVKYNE